LTLQTYPAYKEPQCFLQDNYRPDRPSSDIYSLGVLLWQLTSGHLPFFGKQNDRVAALIARHDREEPVDGTSPEYVALYKECWQDSPEMRPSAAEVLQQLQRMRTKAIPGDWVLPFFPVQPPNGQKSVDPPNSPPDLPPVQSPTDWQKQELELAVDLYLACLRTDSKESWEKWTDWRGENNQRKEQLFNYLIGSDYGGRHRELMIAEFYRRGFGVEANLKEAFNWTEKAIKAEDSWAHHYYYQCYIEGWGVEKDGRKAFDSATAAADSKLPFGWHNLGMCYSSGMGAILNPKLAKENYMLAANAEYVSAQTQLGHMLKQQGEYSEALRWYQKAQQHGEDLHTDVRDVDKLLRNDKVL
jgi:tetratricopeptide (TPR) repeat protein